MRRGSSGVSWMFFLSAFFSFAGFSHDSALNSKLCLHQGFWSLTICWRNGLVQPMVNLL